MLLQACHVHISTYEALHVGNMYICTYIRLNLVHLYMPCLRHARTSTMHARVRMQMHMISQEIELLVRPATTQRGPQAPVSEQSKLQSQNASNFRWAEIASLHWPVNYRWGRGEAAHDRGRRCVRSTCKARSHSRRLNCLGRRRRQPVVRGGIFRMPHNSADARLEGP